jgi:Flp pilus assembly protein TadG
MRADHQRRRRDESGSALFLMPVGVVIVLLLGALVADTAFVFMAKREVMNGATAAANDAAAAALDVDHFRRTGDIRLRPERVAAVARSAVSRRTAGMFAGSPEVRSEVGPDGSVVVSVRGTVAGLLWAPAGVFDRTVQARITARAEPGASG